jgi:uncharacterized YigZ family protein
MKDTYKTVAAEVVVQSKIQRSIFIAHARETGSEEEVREFIGEIKEKHKQATHNCWAYQIGLGKRTQAHYDDDGEPSGSAGKPILGAIMSRDLTNVTVVVTRYFGGRKLGIRGLIDAYGETAGMALDEKIVTKIIRRPFYLTCDYPQLDQITYLVKQYRGKIIQSNYQERISLKIAIPPSQLSQAKRVLREYGELK